MSRSYRRRLEQDLDRWIAAGLVGAEKRAAILASLSEARAARLSAATALGLSGAILLGLAAIAFVMANWEAIPRALRLALILALLWGALAGAMWAGPARARAREGFAVLAALIFAAGTGVVGQMYNLPGEPWQALALACAGAAALAFAAESRAATAVSLVFALWAYGVGGAGFDHQIGLAELGLVAIGALAALRARTLNSTLLLHFVLVYAAFLVWALAHELTPAPGGWDEIWLAPRALIVAAVWAGAAAAAWRLRRAPGWRAIAPATVGYGVWIALAAFAIWGFEVRLATAEPDGVDGEGAALAFTLVHRTVWLAASVGLIALGRAERLAWTTGAGVVGAVGACLAILYDLGLDLLQIAGLFLAFAIAALAAAFAVARRRERPS